MTGNKKMVQRASLILIFVISILVVTTVLADHEPVGLTIDSFIEPQVVEQAGPPPQTNSQSVTAVGTTIGDERDVQVTITQGMSTLFGLSFIADVGTGGVSLDATTVLGLVNLIWDGPDGDPDIIDFDGLDGVDLTDGGRLSGYHIHVDSADAPFIMRFRVYASSASGTDWSEWVFNETASSVNEKSYFIPFGLPPDNLSGAGADETNAGAITLQIDATQVASVNLDLNLDFVEIGSKDYGDLPAGYGVTVGGANHILNDLYLGVLIDGELDGLPNATATGDDTDNEDDEDGVIRIGIWANGVNGASIDVVVSDVNNNGGCLSAWMDWNGATTNPGDLQLVIDRQPVVDGVNSLTFDVPPDTFSNNGADPDLLFNSRFRLYPDTGSPGCGDEPIPDLVGEVFNGEVEDYQWGFEPTAVSLATFSVTSQMGLMGTAVAALALILGVVTVVFFVTRRQLGV